MFLLLMILSLTILQTRAAIQSAATDAQIRFAIENKYDDTGPGAKDTEYAYKTYNTLEEALVAYLDDPDTTLPEHERAKALQVLMKSSRDYSQYNPEQSFMIKQDFGSNQKQYALNEYNRYFTRAHPEAVKHYNAFRNDDIRKIVNNLPERSGFQEPTTNFRDSFPVRGPQFGRPTPIRYQNVAKNTLGLSHYKKLTDLEPRDDRDFDHNPRYTYSYGVDDKKTGDSKSAQESRDGGTVSGHYSFVDADGRRRTVHYTANGNTGFRAVVQRSTDDQ